MSSKTAQIKRMVELANSSDIASIRSVVSGIVRIINDPNSNAKDLKDIIEIDPPLTARVLRVANSAWYAPAVHIGEVVQAIVRIGFNALKELVLHQKVCDVFHQSDNPVGSYTRPQLWKHSVAVALLAKMIYRREFAQKGENAYVAGLIHDIGIIVIDQFRAPEFSTILRKAETDRTNLLEAEQAVLQFNHAEIGMALLENWNLPPEYVTAVGYHHKPHLVPEDCSRFTATLYVANHLCQEKNIGYGDMPLPDHRLFTTCLNNLGLKPLALKLIVNEVVQELNRMEEHGLL